MYMTRIFFYEVDIKLEADGLNVHYKIHFYKKKIGQGV